MARKAHLTSGVYGQSTIVTTAFETNVSSLSLTLMLAAACSAWQPILCDARNNCTKDRTWSSFLQVGLIVPPSRASRCQTVIFRLERRSVSGMLHIVLLITLMIHHRTPRLIVNSSAYCCTCKAGDCQQQYTLQVHCCVVNGSCIRLPVCASVSKFNVCSILTLSSTLHSPWLMSF
jgi:hypothetical protein